MGNLIDEIKSGGVKGIFGLDQMDWGAHGGAFYEIWKLSPCCGDPVSLEGCLRCVLHWQCLGWLTFMRTFAWSQDIECAIIPHCVPFLCCLGPCTRVAFRYNLRHKAGVSGNCCGDAACIFCCGVCAMCQELRSIPRPAWEVYPLKLQAPKVMLCV